MHFRSAIATVSLGRAAAGHTLFQKLRVAAEHSFDGIELFYECLEHHALSLPGGLSEPNLVIAAEQTREECDRLGLQILCIQPFLFSEGLTSPNEKAQIMLKLKLWFRLSKALGTDIIQIPSNFQSYGTTGDLDKIVADLKEFSRLALLESPVIRFAYEALSWGNHIDTWEQSWDIVKRVNMPNLGLCLDTFHIAGGVWADPNSLTGKMADGEEDLKNSLARISSELDLNKVFYIQIGDAERLDPPLPENPIHVSGQPQRLTWSRNARLFPYETELGGYLPITIILDVLVKSKGFRGWVSMEVFHRDLFERDEGLPRRWAERGAQAWKRFLEGNE